VAEGWLLSCDPNDDRFAAEVHDGASEARADGCAALAYGAADAERVLRAYLNEGAEAFAGDLGASSCAVWDSRTRALHLARDRTGLLPLFHARNGRTCIAGVGADEVMRQPGLSSAPNRIAVAEWLAGALTAPDETLLAALRRVPAGHVLVLDGGGERLLPVWVPPAPGSIPAEHAGAFGDTLERAVGRAVRSEQAAVFLSGGLDSCAVAAAAATAAQPPLTALCVEIAGASEADVQRSVADRLGMTLEFSNADRGENLLERALERARSSLWPVGALWQPAFDELALRGREAGVGVILDGQGGDELLDVGLGPGIDLARRLRIGRVADLVRANRTYTGASVSASLRQIARSRQRRPRAASPLPEWLAPDPELRREVLERRVPIDQTYGALRRADLVDPYLAHAREEGFVAGQRDGVVYRHPLWDPEVVALLHGLPPEAFVAAGEPKSPARRYLRRRIPGIAGRWPRPLVADDLFADVLGAEAPAAWRRCGGPRALAELGVVGKDPPIERYPVSATWSILAMEFWLRSRGERQP